MDSTTYNSNRLTSFIGNKPRDSFYPLSSQGKINIQDNNTIRESILSNKASLLSNNKLRPSEISFAGRNSILGKKETRPINDKKFQREVIDKIFNYLSTNSYPYPITSKSFNVPSQLLFSQIFEFIFRNFDASFSIQQKYDPEFFLKALKSIGYPFNLQKSVLSCNGSLISWHNSLATIYWMIEAIEILQNIPLNYHNMFKCDVESVDNTLLKMYELEMVTESYKHFMQNGNNDHRDEICQNFLASYENSEIKNDIDESERKRLENECEILKIKLQEFERLKQKRIDLEAESRDLNVYREQCRNHLTHLIDNQSEKIAITNTLKSKLEKEEIEHRALIAKLNTQKFSKKDMKIIQDKKFQLGNDIESIGKEILQLEKNKAIQDDQLNTLTEKVNASCIITNTRMMELELYNCKYELRAHQLTPEKLEEMQVFLRGTVENARQTVSSVRTLLEKESETLEQLKKDIVSKLNSISYLEASIKSADFDLKAKNEECEAKCTATVNQKREICEELRTLTEEFNKVQMKISLAEKVVQAHKLRICEEDEQYQEQDKYFEEVFKTDMEHFLKAQKTVKDAYEATQMRIDKFIAEQSEDDEEN